VEHGAGRAADLARARVSLGHDNGIAFGHNQLAEVDRGWRGHKQVRDLRPVYHRKEERIRAHVILCWPALVPVRVAETTCGDRWPHLRRELERLQVGTFEGQAGLFRKGTDLTAAKKAVFRKRRISEPPELQEDERGKE